MATTHVRFLPILLATALLGACGERLDIEVKASIDGRPAPQAKVTVDREELGVTDARGVFTQRLRKKAGTEVEVTVSKEAPGYRIDPWKTVFLVKLPKGDEIVTYRVEADLKATRYVTVRVSEGGTPVPEAKVTVGEKEEGVTDAKGEFVYSYRTQPAKGAELRVAKPGFSTYRATRQLEPGQVVEVALNRQTVVAIKAMTEEYGRVSGVPGLSVSIDGKPVGKTDAQ
ncbi:MAG TPA: carboxypeptidase-like regulatory domain-containing protein, partial [Burkholderiales bacterium]|nr:carboxypeptidase-like regulatory domain-containing protein [Burkholderiales bacterium]